MILPDFMWNGTQNKTNHLKNSTVLQSFRKNPVGRYPLYEYPSDLLSSLHTESTRQAEQALGRSLRSLLRAAGPAYSPAAVRAYRLRHPYMLQFPFRYATV